MGNLVDWHIDNKMAVVLVGGVSVTSGHQLPKTSPKGGSGSLTPGGRGRKLHQWSKDGSLPPTPTPTPSCSGSAPSDSAISKGKAKASPEPELEDNADDPADDDDEDEMPPPKKQG